MNKKTVFLFCAAAASSVIMAISVKKDETIIFFPTVSKLNSETGKWDVLIHGQVFEKEEDSKTRNYFIEFLRSRMKVEQNTPEADIFKERMRWFLIDNQRWKTVKVRLQNLSYKLNRSKANGHFEDQIKLEVKKESDGKFPETVSYTAELPDDDSRHFSGKTYLVPDTGISLVTDIDDTIKISDVRNKDSLLKNTFQKPFKEVPGMGDLYSSWAKKNVQINYVSASPWQMYTMLSEFFQSKGFPDGVYHMKYVRLTDTDFFNLMMAPDKYKIGTIEPLIKQFPKRKFILVGDSGEKDPEAYAFLAEKYPDQVLQILIRDAYPEDGPKRLNEVFSKIPKEKWQSFQNASDIKKDFLKNIL